MFIHFFYIYLGFQLTLDLIFAELKHKISSQNNKFSKTHFKTF